MKSDVTIHGMQIVKAATKNRAQRASPTRLASKKAGMHAEDMMYAPAIPAFR